MGFSECTSTRLVRRGVVSPVHAPAYVPPSQPGRIDVVGMGVELFFGGGGGREGVGTV